MKIYIIILLCLVAIGCNQSPEEKGTNPNLAIDSLLNNEGRDTSGLKSLANSQDTPDTTRVRLLNKLALNLVDSQSDSAIIFANQALEMAKKISFKPGEAEALRIIGYYHMQNQEYGISNAHLNRSLAMWATLDNKGKQKNINALLGKIAEQLSNFPDALEHYLASLRFAEQLGDSLTAVDMRLNIGSIYGRMGQQEKSIPILESALRSYESMGDSLRIARACNNLGNVLDDVGRYIEARTYLNRAIMLVKAMRNPMGEAITLGSLANHFHFQAQYDSALIINKQILFLFEQIGDPFSLAAASINTGEILTLMKRYEEAKEYLNKGIEYAESVGAKQWLSNAHAALYDIANRQGDDASALKQYMLHIDYRDSITNEENTRKSVQVQMQYDFDKKEAETKAEQEKKNQHQRLIRNSIGGGLAISLLFLGVVWRQRNRISKEKARSEELLLNILPEEVAEELKANGSAEAVQIDQVTVLFTDFKGFTSMSEVVTPQQLVRDLNECFSAFDRITEKYGIEKIKTIGDAYMAAGGLPTPNNTHTSDVIQAAFEMRDFIELGKARKIEAGLPFFEIRIGIHTGPVVAGIVGVKKFQYDIWGDTVNTASRMESSGETGKINISGSTYQLVKDIFKCEHRGKIPAKNKGEIDMYFVEG